MGQGEREDENKNEECRRGARRHPRGDRPSARHHERDAKAQGSGGNEAVGHAWRRAPENDGRTNVWYAILEARPDLHVEFVAVAYDYQRLADEMRAEKLPEEFVQTVLTGWWTTCLEILPSKERRRGKY